MERLSALMKDGKVHFVNGVLARNVKKILYEVVETGVGAIVASNKKGGTSQTLEFLSQFLLAQHQQKCFIFKISLKTEGEVAPPKTIFDFYLEFRRVFFVDGGVKAQCERFLRIKLMDQGAPISDDGALDLDLCGEKFDKGEPMHKTVGRIGNHSPAARKRNATFQQYNRKSRLGGTRWEVSVPNFLAINSA